MRGKNDFFDRLMQRPSMERFRPFYHHYKEMILYVFFGCGTFLISVLTYALFTELFCWDILFSNAISWIFATLFAFYTNRTWVFSSHAVGVVAFFLQLGSFSLGRFLTLLMEEWMLYFFVGQLGLSNMFIKLIAQIVVIILNYVLSKLIVFRKRR